MAIESKRSTEKQKTTRLNHLCSKSDQQLVSPSHVNT